MENENGETDWKKEAFLLYHYLLNEENKSSKIINKILNDFSNQIDKEKDPNKRRSLFEQLKIDIYNNSFEDDSTERSLLLLLLISNAIKEFENKYEKNISSIKNLEELLKFNNEENIVKEIEKQLQENKDSLEKVIPQLQNRIDLIERNEMYRSVNERRLELIRARGFQFKTTFMIDDERTGDDSRYFNSLNQVRRLDENFEYEWEGDLRVFQYGPDRPNDRSIVIPYS